MSFYKVGKSKAATLLAAFELTQRFNHENQVHKLQIRCSKDAYHAIAPKICDINHEEFWVIILNRANRIIGYEKTSSGGSAGTVCDTKIMFKKILEYERLSSIVISHNHPSGNITPSQSDIELTKKIAEGCRLLDIKLLDHIIVAGNQYTSFMDEGYL